MDDTTAAAHDAFFRYTYAVHWLRLSTNGIIERCNDAVGVNLGVATAELVGRPLFDFVTTPDADRIREALRTIGVMRFAAEILSHDTSTAARDRALDTMGRQITQLTRLVEDSLSDVPERSA